MPSARIGLLGCGLWGANVLRDLQALGAQVHVVDLDAQARLRAMAGGAASAVADAEQVRGLDGWVIATPASAHRAGIEALAAQGHPVLCEKPLAASLADAHATAACAQGPVHVMDVWRYHPAVEALQGIAHGGELGVVRGLRSTRANWTSPRTDVDSAWNLLPHEISIYLQVIGSLPEPQAALAEIEQGQARSVWSQWSGAAWMASEVSNRSPRRRRELQLHCEQGVACWSIDRPDVVEIAAGAADERLEASSLRLVALGGDTALRRQLAAWLAYLAGGSAPRTDLAHAIHAMERIARVRALAGLAA